MKHLIAPFIALAVTLGGVSHAQQARLKVGTVDMEALFQSINTALTVAQAETAPERRTA